LIYYGAFLVLLAIKLWWDLKERKRGVVINHFKSAMFDSAFYIGFGLLLFGVKGAGFILLAYWLRWLLFDLLYNKFTNKDTFYCGEESAIDEWADAFDGIEDNVCKVVFFIKVIGIIVTLAMIYLMYR
jgi:hypothetical protein